MKIPEYHFNVESIFLIFDVLNDPVLIHPFLEKGFGSFINANKAACIKYGYTLEEFCSLSASDITIKEDIALHSKSSQRAKLKKKQSDFIHTSHITKSGETFPVEISSNIISLNNRAIIISIIHDLSQREKDRSEIHEKTIKLEGIFRAAPTGIGVVSNRIFKEVNNRFCEMVGRTPEELIGKSSRIIYPTDADYNKAGKTKYDQIRKTGLGTVETRLQKKDGTIINIIMSSTPIDISDYSKGVIFTALDITTRKTQEKELKAHKENLEKLVLERTYELEAINEELKAVAEELHQKNNTIEDQKNDLEKNLNRLKETQEQLIQTEKMASLGILTAGVAHEINNPLNFIKGGHNGLIAFFESSDCEKSEEATFFLHSIDEGINRATKIVNGLNQYNRNNDSQEELCPINLIMDNCLQILYNTYKTKVEITKKYAENELIIKGNVGKLHQVFSNILSNSIDSIIDRGNIIIKSKVENEIIITIQDNGYGIDKKDIAKIYDPFFTTKAPGEGTGLGLFISKSIIEEHKGKLSYKSQKNKGTIATIVFPLDKDIQ